MDYKICIRARNQEWYNRAKEYPSVKEFAMWDDGRTHRYIVDVKFRFKFPVESVEEFKGSAYEFSCVDKEKKEIKLYLSGLRLLKFKGVEKSGVVVISESLLHQEISHKKGNGANNYYIYLKGGVIFYNPLRHVYLSDEHCEELTRNHPEGLTLKSEATEFISGQILRPYPMFT
jgi:hypothetical protein